MRIPTYQQNIVYQRVHAQPGTLATPVLEQDGIKQSQREFVAHLMNAAGKFALNVADRERKEKAYRGELGVAVSTDKGAAIDRELAVSFSSPKRQELYEFGRSQMIAASQPASMAKKVSADPVKDLDQFFGQQVMENQADFSLQEPDRNLLVQDYGILRREMAYLQQKQQEETQKETFRQSAGQFIQTAGLIRTPGALEQYVQSNLLAAESEFSASADNKNKDWPSKKQALYTQAITHNIEVALQAGEVHQAQQVYTYFKEHLPQSQQNILQTKVNNARASETASHLAPLMYESCISPEGDIERNKIAEQVHQYAPSTEKEEKQICQAIEMHLADEVQQRLQKESRSYLALLENDKNLSDSRSILAMWRGSKEQLQQAEKLAAALHQPKKHPTEPAVFNDLQYDIYYGRATQQKIDTAFDEGNLSAVDALRLKSRCCQARAATVETKDKVLFRSVYRLCRHAGLDQYETEEAVYNVFSSGEDTQAHWQAAQELKKWLML